MIPTSFPEGFLGAGKIPDEELAYSFHKWNRALTYGVKFDEVQLQRPGLSTFVPGERFYSHPLNQLYVPPLLKLHGSLNWFKYTGIQRFNFGEQSQREDRTRRTLLLNHASWFHMPATHDGEITEPVIVTPVLHKNLNKSSIIDSIWSQALKELSDCKRLIIGGYSFAPTDFNTKRLFLEAFETRSPDQLTVINPDTRVVQIAKDLCHFRKPVITCRDLDEFITLSDS